MDNSNDKPESLLNPGRAEGLRGEEEVHISDRDGNGDRSTRPNGNASRNQPVGASGTVSKGNYLCQPSGSEAGSSKKLIDQLEEFFTGYLTYVESHEERLKARLDANQEHQKLMKGQFEQLKQSLFQLVETEPEEE